MSDDHDADLDPRLALALERLTERPAVAPRPEPHAASAARLQSLDRPRRPRQRSPRVIILAAAALIAAGTVTATVLRRSGPVSVDATDQRSAAQRSIEHRPTRQHHPT